jgi:hypothetical protein
LIDPCLYFEEDMRISAGTGQAKDKHNLHKNQAKKIFGREAV